MTALDAGRLGRLLADACERHRVPGAQLALYRAGRLLFAEAGVQRHGGAIAVGRQSSFPYGSVTKSFTATVVMQLVSDGEVELDEPIGAYLPDLAGAPNGLDRLVTTRHLLSHTSGLPGDFASDDAAPASFRRYALVAARLAPVHAPGTAFSYSNVGFVLAGLLIEDVTGMTWWDAVESLLLGPLDIEPVFLVDPRIPARPGPAVTGHSVTARRQCPVPVQPLYPIFDGPAGGLAGSAGDLVKFARMHLRAGAEPAGMPHRSQLEAMRGTAGEVTPFGLAAGWGLGLARFRAGDVDWFGHDGTTEGTTSHLRFQPEQAVALAVTTNATSGLRLWDDVLDGLRGAGLAVGTYPDPVITAAATEVPDCAGDYLNGDVRYSVVPTGGGAYGLDMDDGLCWRLTFYQGLQFSAESPAGDQPPVAGRFLPGQGSDEIALMEIGGRVARRCQRRQAGRPAERDRCPA